MTRIHPITPGRPVSEDDAKTSSSGRAHSPNFLVGMLTSLRRAGLGRFFGSAPAMTQGRTNSLNDQVPVGEGENAETRQAKDIYQSMLDITGY